MTIVRRTAFLESPNLVVECKFDDIFITGLLFDFSYEEDFLEVYSKTF